MGVSGLPALPYMFSLWCGGGLVSYGVVSEDRTHTDALAAAAVVAALCRSACLQHELGQLVLKRFLLLVLLLDKAATHLTAAFRTPLLFKLTASIKSSRQVGPAVLVSGASHATLVPAGRLTGRPWVLRLPV
jgi:hypothetical protein